MEIPRVSYRFGDSYWVTDFVVPKNPDIQDVVAGFGNVEGDKFVEAVAAYVRDNYQYPLWNGNPTCDGQLLRYTQGVLKHGFKCCEYYVWAFPPEVIQSKLGYCLMPDTLIKTSSGYKPICQVQVGEKVLTHKSRYREVTQTFRRPYSGQLVKLIVSNPLKPLLCTPEHPILYFDGRQEKWTKAEDVKRGGFVCFPKDTEIIDLDYIRVSDFLSIPHTVLTQEQEEFVVPVGKHTTNCKRIKNLIPVDRRLLRLFGFYVAEGSLMSKGMRFSFAATENEYIKEVSESMSILFNVDGSIDDSKPWCKSIYFSSVVLRDFFSELVKRGAKNKVLPSFISKLPKDKVLNFIETWVRGDGHPYGNHLRGTTASTDLAVGMWDLLVNHLDMPTSVRTSRNEKSTYGGGLVHLLDIYGSSAEKLSQIMGLRYEPKYRHQPRNYFSLAERGYRRVRQVGFVDYAGEVFNLEVDEDNSYVANGITVHNCAETGNLAESLLVGKLDSLAVLGDVLSLNDTLLGRHEWVETPYHTNPYINASDTFVLETTIHTQGANTLASTKSVYDKSSDWAKQGGLYYSPQARFNDKSYEGSNQFITLMGLPAKRVLLFGLEETQKVKAKKLYKEFREERAIMNKLLKQAWGA